MPSKEQSFQRFLSKFIIVFNRISLPILQNTLSKRSFEDFTVTLQPRDPEKKKNRKKRISLPPRKNENSPNPVQFYRSSIAKNKLPEWLEHPSPVNHPPGSAYYSREDEKMRAKRWIARASTGNPAWKNGYTGEKGGKNEEEEGEEEASQIQLIEYRSHSSSSSSCFVFSPSFITETVDPPTWTNRAIRALYETAGYFARSRPLSRAPFPVWVERANKVSGAVLPWKRIGKEYRREEGW